MPFRFFEQARSLAGRVVVITGGARGVGLETGRLLAARGARVALADLDGALAHAEASGIAGTSGFHVDVGDRESFAALLCDVTDRLGPVDILVNNAGVMHLGTFLNTQPRTIAQQIDVNLLGVVHGMQLTIPAMLRRGGGHVVNVNSAAGKWGVPGENIYSACKHAVVGLTELVREELRGDPVELSLVFFGPTSTQLALGMRPQRGIKITPIHIVAAAIAGTLEHPRPEVWVPASLGRSWTMGQVLPRPLRQAAQRFLGMDRVATDIDHLERAPYEQRTFGGDDAGERSSTTAGQHSAP
jgi:NAD(P)-dependent dehydrogenase (short-subunit alcohol dehydrogenase family)